MHISEKVIIQYIYYFSKYSCANVKKKTFNGM